MKCKLLVTVLFLSIAFLNSAMAAGFMAVANVSKIQGAAFINKEKIKEGAEIAEGMELSIPKAKDYVEVKFQNGHVVRFSGATVKVTNLNPKNTLFTLIKGKMYSVIKALTKDETFKVKTKEAAFAVRGTKFYIEAAKKQAYLCVCDGTVSTTAGKKEVDVNKDEDLTYNGIGELKATLAAKVMINSSNDTFKDMGF